eukprot:TRINITY_DN26570_c0_g1_i1.p1 TRINITY_DN26570_c0_g1~~TRINITY_DN26570_c0_g1_i1.p1  ORF type:complete len:268 (-),score=50.23 TRINITY_DN26570_c0_g1_i1:117-920(-)
MPSSQPTIKDARLLSVEQIRFSQNSIGSNFKDGRSVEQLTNDMKAGKTHVWDIPPIRVYETQNGNFVTHDNRRLKVAKDANLKEVPVLVTEGRVPDFKFTSKDKGRSVEVVPSHGSNKGSGKITTTSYEIAQGARKPKGAAVFGEIFREKTVHNSNTGVTEVTREHERYQILPGSGKGAGKKGPLVIADAGQSCGKGKDTIGKGKGSFEKGKGTASKDSAKKGGKETGKKSSKDNGKGSQGKERVAQKGGKDKSSKKGKPSCGKGQK